MANIGKIYFINFVNSKKNISFAKYKVQLNNCEPEYLVAKY